MKNEPPERLRMVQSTALLLEEIHRRLVPLWPEARPLLRYRNCFELLIAVILSAQTTDEQVNTVTEELFSRYPNAKALAGADAAEVERIIHPLGFFHVKARHIIDTAEVLEARFGGNIPPTFEEMLALPGVGRKTANLVASACLEVPGVIVDTHVLRVLVRLGVCPKKDATLAETIVRANLSSEKHTQFSYSVNRHGKFTCAARNPACTQTGQRCPLDNLCPKIGVKRESSLSL